MRTKSIGYRIPRGGCGNDRTQAKMLPAWGWDPDGDLPGGAVGGGLSVRSSEGFHVREGVIPAGFPDKIAARNAINGGHWAAGVSRAEDAWIDAQRQFQTELEARDEAARMGPVLGVKQGEPMERRTAKERFSSAGGSLVMVRAGAILPAWALPMAEERESGLSGRLAQSQQGRMLRQDGEFNVQRVG